MLCSHYHDFESLHGGCTADVNTHGTGPASQPFPPSDLKGMLERSAACTATYNEVLLDSAVYARNLPHSVAGFYYGLLGSAESVSHVSLAVMRRGEVRRFGRG